VAEDAGKPKLPWGRALLRSATSPWSLIVGGGAAVGALAIHSIPLLLLGGAAYATMVALDMANRETWRAAIRGERPQLPDPSTLADPAARRMVEELRSAKRELSQVLAQGGDQVARYVGMALDPLTELEDRAARLVRRSDDLSRYLATIDTGKVRAEIDRLEQNAQRTADAAARDEFRRARGQREQQLTTVAELVAALDRVHANLARIVATYEALPARVVHMRALDAQAVDAMSGDVSQELDRMNHEIAAFEETLKSVEVRA
jgi:hypothetical protein